MTRRDLRDQLMHKPVGGAFQRMQRMPERIAADGRKQARKRAADAADAACGSRGSRHVRPCAAIATTTGRPCRNAGDGPGVPLCCHHRRVLIERGRCIAVGVWGRCPLPVGPTGCICHAGHDLSVAMQVAVLPIEKRERWARAHWERLEEL